MESTLFFFQLVSCHLTCPICLIYLHSFRKGCFSTAVDSFMYVPSACNEYFFSLSSLWQKKRCKMKGGERESVTAADCGPESQTVSVPQFLPMTSDGDASTCSSREGVAEGSSEGSSSSSSSSSSSTAWDEPSSSVLSINGHCVGLNNGQLPITKSKTEKRSFKRRRSKLADQQPQSHGHYRAGLLHTPIPVATCVMPTLQQLMKGKQELGMGTFGVTAVTGHV